MLSSQVDVDSTDTCLLYTSDVYKRQDKDYAFEDSESFAEHGVSKKEFDDNEELVDIEEEESPEKMCIRDRH